jgi:hypothetical protein
MKSKQDHAIDKCKAVFDLIEWNVIYDATYDAYTKRCPLCKSYEADGHKVNCLLHDAIRTINNL